MTAPTILFDDLKIFSRKLLTNEDWNFNFQLIVDWLTSGDYDVSFNDITAKGNITVGGVISGDGSGLTNLPGSGGVASSSGGGLEVLALANALEKQIGSRYPLPKSNIIRNAFVNTSVFNCLLRQVHDTSTAGTTIILDHGIKDIELQNIDDFETFSNFTANAGTPVLANDTVNKLEGTQSIKMTTSGATGTFDMFNNNYSFSADSLLLRVSVFLDYAGANLESLRVVIESSAGAGNDVRYDFPQSQLTTGWNHLTIDLDSTPSASAGTFDRTNITKIYYQIQIANTQVVNASWDLLRTISNKPLLSPNYSLELPIQDNLNQEIISLISEDRTDNTTKGTFSLAIATANDYPNTLATTDLEDAFISTQTGTIVNTTETHDSSASGQNLKTAITTETLYLDNTTTAPLISMFIRYSDELFTVKEFTSDTSLKVDSETDKSSFFDTNDYIILFKAARIGYKDRSFEGSDIINFKRLQLNTNGIFNTNEILLVHNESNDIGSDNTNYFIMRESAYIKAVIGSKTANSVQRLIPSAVSIAFENILKFEDSFNRANGDPVNNWTRTTGTLQWDITSNIIEADTGTNGNFNANFGRNLENYSLNTLTDGFSNTYFEIKFTNNLSASISALNTEYNISASSINIGDGWRTVLDYFNSKVDVVINSGGVVATNSFSFSSGIWYSVRILANSNIIKVKVWQKGTTEPSSFLVSYNSSVKVNTGSFINFIARQNFNTNVGGTFSHAIDNYSITTPQRDLTLKYSELSSGAVDKISLFAYNDRADTTNQNPIIYEIAARSD